MALCGEVLMGCCVKETTRSVYLWSVEVPESGGDRSSRKCKVYVLLKYSMHVVCMFKRGYVHTHLIFSF